jgi:hypothetical protein
MQYILISKTGQVFTFSLEAVALQYKLAYGGTLLSATKPLAQTVAQNDTICYN